MDHDEAMRLAAVERYLLQELSPEQCAEFEEHFFNCPECAVDLRATAAFLHAVKREIKNVPPRARSASPGWRIWGARGWLAVAASLLFFLSVIAYQNLVVYPRLMGELTRRRQPTVLVSLPVIRGVSRGGVAPAGLTASAANSILLPIQIPPEDQVLGYECVVLDSSGHAVWRSPVSVRQAKDTVYIAFQSGTLRSGLYTLRVQGQRKEADGGPINLITVPLSISD
jgi:hypothetical protein